MYQSLKIMNIPIAKLDTAPPKTSKTTTKSNAINTFLRPSQDSFVIKKNPFSSKFYNQLLQWEEDFHTNNLSLDLLDMLVQSYSQLVEYYDYQKDPIKSYFLEKMQFTLSRPTTIKVILRDQSKAATPDRPELFNPEDYDNGRRLPTQMSETSPMMDHSRTFFNDTPSFSRAKQIIIPKTVPFDDDSKHLHRRKNKERATTIQLQVEIENQLGSKSNVKQMVSEYQAQKDHFEELRREEERRQQQRIEEKIQMRRDSVERFSLKGMRKDASTPALRTESEVFTEVNRSRNNSADQRYANITQDAIIESVNTTHILSRTQL